jgi:hypothetical protein
VINGSAEKRRRKFWAGMCLAGHMLGEKSLIGGR